MYFIERHYTTFFVTVYINFIESLTLSIICFIVRMFRLVFENVVSLNWIRCPSYQRNYHLFFTVHCVLKVFIMFTRRESGLPIPPFVRLLEVSCLLIKEIWSNEGRKSVQSITQSLTHISATQENYITSLDCHYSIRKYKRQRSIGSRKMQRYIIYALIHVKKLIPMKNEKYNVRSQKMW